MLIDQSFAFGPSDKMSHNGLTWKFQSDTKFLAN